MVQRRLTGRAMKWRDDLPESRDEAGADPPLVEAPAEMERLQKGIVVRDGRDYAASFGDVRGLVPGVGAVADGERWVSSAVTLSNVGLNTPVMKTDSSKQQIKQAGLSAWRAAVLAAVTLIVLVMFLGMGYLVYRGNMNEGPLILFAGVILGYILRASRDLM